MVVNSEPQEMSRRASGLTDGELRVERGGGRRNIGSPE